MHTPAVQLPQGVRVDIELAPQCVLEGNSEGQAVGIMAAMNTNHFPVLRAQIIDAINGRLAAWH